MSTNLELILEKGKTYYRKSNYEKSIYYLNKAYESPKYKADASTILFQIYFKLGSFDKARTVLNETPSNDPTQNFNLGTLEEYENNLTKALKYFTICLEYPKYHNLALLNIAKIYSELGFYKEALEILNILLNTELYLEAKLEIIYSLTRLKEYEKAYNLTADINPEVLNNIMKKDYNELINILKYRLNILKLSELNREDYKAYLLMTNDNETLLNHIQKHQKQNERFTKGCFFKDLNLKDLLFQIQDKLESYNPIYVNKTDFYRLSLPKSIGFKGDDKTKDITVITLLGTKQIITMYPVKFSSKFDSENLNQDKDLQLTRKKL